MSFDEKTIRSIATLARLKLTPDGTAKFAAEIDGILRWVAQLQEVDVDDIEPLASVSAQKPSMRADAVSVGNLQKELMQNAPEAAHGFYIVPKMVE
ncbi:MAG: Asp-tRNA(Asn)/Glu-tRNA(Gln) amidotransferase subunit GatC [Alphaproteobacteria bacterium]|nr:Asp-tRNA(Asn)/Glu-tRNA(Gln) amidotransferase subunit GatC [Alphaproteobacteria bacterium]